MEGQKKGRIKRFKKNYEKILKNIQRANKYRNMLNIFIYKVKITE